MRILLTVLSVAVFAVGLSGCSGAQPPAQPEPSEPAISEADLERLEDENAELREEIDRLREQATTQRRGETVEVLSTDLYFESGSAQLSDEGVTKLKSVAERIQREFPDRTLRVEGYTDTTPIGPSLKDRFPSNWELSAARAAAVVRHLQWTHEIRPTRFEVVGYGPYQPVASNETEEGRRKNRRVRIAVLPNTESASISPANGPSSSTKSRW